MIRLKVINTITVFCALTLWSCGTGPWYIQKDLYQVYKEPIVSNSTIPFRTNGFYAQITDVDSVDYSKNILIFDNNGYCIWTNYEESIKSMDNIIYIEAELDWWKINNDSIIIESYGETKRLIKTMVWWYKGRLVNDSIIELSYQDDYYRMDALRFRFIESDVIPKLRNVARYMSKEWYKSNLDASRQ